MPNEIVARAAHNNALWCDVVCATHHGPGEFHENLWLNRFGVPRYYPDVVTLIGADAAAAQTEAISAWVSRSPIRSWAVKDSFQSLDLSRHGFTPLFDAEWIVAPSDAHGDHVASRKLNWRRVENEHALPRWEQSWSEEPAEGRSRIFKPALLANPDVQFLFAVDQGANVGGGILNRGAGVVGVTNVFARGADMNAIWRGLAQRARTAFPGLPIVSYDHGGERLRAAYRAGFQPVGGLRIWRKGPAELN